MSRRKTTGKGSLLGIIILAIILFAVLGGNKNSSSSTTRSTSSVSTGTTAFTKAPIQKITETPIPTASPSPTPEPTTVPELTSGSTGEEVTTLQELLSQYGYMSASISGRYDSVTIKAVKDFQINNDLKETGICDKETWKKISGRPKWQEVVYKSKNGKVYHSESNCSGMKTATEMTLSDALRKNLTPCSHCH